MNRRHARHLHRHPGITTLSTTPKQPNSVPPLDTAATEIRINRMLIIARYRAWRHARH
ncbi:hypothetical protein ACXC9Q_41560 [Kribbella sp. CWNU-51]